jgi:Rod binding domain-containing protein
MDVLPTQPRINPADIPLEQLAGNQSLSKGEKVKEVCRQFEAVLLRQILGDARKTVISSGDPEENSTTAQIYNDMINNQLADSISRSGGLGLSKSLEAQLVHQVLPGTSAPTSSAAAPAAGAPAAKAINPHHS